jgi:hypothetical protein
LAGDWNDGAGVVAMGKDFTTHTAFNPGALCAIIRDLSGAGFYVYKTSNGSSFTRVAGFDYNGKLRIGNAVAGDVTGTAKSYKIEVFDANGNSRGYVQTYVGP